MSGPRAVVVGGGIYGQSCAVRLRELGASVTVVDPRPPAHEDQASGGITRVLRFEYGDAGVYTDLTLRARESWRELERAGGREIYREIGILYLVGDDDSGEWERLSLRTTRDRGVAGVELSAADVARRWPSIRADGVDWAIWNPNGGMLHARRATRLVADRALDAGARVLPRRATSLATGRVRLDDGTSLHADVVVVAAGAWTARLLPGLTITPTRQVTVYFDGGPRDIPVFAEGAPFAHYGFPAHDGNGLKVGAHARGPEGDPDGPREPGAAAVARAREYVGRRFGMAADVASADVCFYAMTPTEDPVVATVDDGLVVCAGFSGHGFKFAPVVGAAAAELALGREPSVDLSPFAAPSPPGPPGE